MIFKYWKRLLKPKCLMLTFIINSKNLDYFAFSSIFIPLDSISIFISIYIYIYREREREWEREGRHSLMVTVIGNGISDSCSNPWWYCLYFTSDMDEEMSRMGSLALDRQPI